MAASAVARAMAFIFVAIQSYFKWFSSDDVLLDSPGDGNYLTSTHHLAGLILARGGSKGIPRKNMVPLNGQPLIHWALKAMVDSGAFTTVWVSTDDTNTSEWIKKTYPAVRVHSRAPYTATDDATSIIAVQEFLSFHPEIDAIGLVQATSPFILPTYLTFAASLLRKFDSVFSVTRSHDLRWKAVDNNQKSTAALNFDPKNRPRRQDWSGEMIENGMFYFTMRDVIVYENLFQGKRSGYVEISKTDSLQIDTSEDLEMAKFLVKSFQDRTKSEKKEKLIKIKENDKTEL